MLHTKLKHLETRQDIKEVLDKNKNVMVCCGRMGPMCFPVYGAMIDLENEYENVTFRDMDFDTPDAEFFRSLPECSNFKGLPFTVYFKNGKVVEATSSIQSKDQIKKILDREFTR